MKEEEWIQFQSRGTGQFNDLVSCWRKGPKGRLKQRPLREVVQAVAEGLSAMANADGGTIFLGAEAEGDPAGTYFDERASHLLIRKLEQSTVPPLQFKVAREEIKGVALLKFIVPPSPAVHLLTAGRCYLRVGGQNVSLSKERIGVMKDARLETWHEREVLRGSSLNDLDENLVNEFIHRLGILGEPEKALHRPYGLIEYHNGKALLTRAAAYLFGKDPLRWHPRPEVDFVRFEGKEKGAESEYNVVERIRIEAPILRLIREAEGVVGGRIKERVVLRDLFFREKFEYPSFAWREALVNALAHRDYRLEGSAVEVWMFDERIEVRSPGKLPGPVRIQQLFHRKRVHYSRNPLISRALADLGLMRGLGEGLPQLFREMDQHGLNPPELKEEGNFFCLILKNTPVFDESTLAWLKRFNGRTLNPRQKRILAYARCHGMIFSSPDYQKFGVDRDTAYTEIRDLVKKKIVQPFKKHGKVYRLLENEDTAATLPGLKWVMEALEKKGSFTLSDLKPPMSIPRRKALAMMRDLAGQGYFTVSGKGRATEYRPTEQLNLILAKKKEAAES